MPGVVRRQQTDAQGGVVAGALAFDAQAAGGEPAQRMKPEKSGGDMSRQQDRRIAAADVGCFVGEHGAAARDRPRVGARREQNGGAPQACHQRAGDAGARQQRMSAARGAEDRANPDSIANKTQREDERARGPQAKEYGRRIRCGGARGRRDHYSGHGVDGWQGGRNNVLGSAPAQRSEQQGRRERAGPHQVPRGGRGAMHRRGRAPGEKEHDGDAGEKRCHGYLPSRRACSIMAAMRSSSAGLGLLPRSAAITCSDEPLKSVSSMCRKAELRARAGATFGR